MRLAPWLMIFAGIGALSSGARADDHDAPVLIHTPLKSGTLGAQATITARVTDESEVFPPSLSYRSAGEGRWKVVNMRGNKQTQFSAEIPLTADSEYWIEVYDEYGNGPATSGSSSRPHRITANAPVVVERTPLPKPARPPEPKPAQPQKDETPPVVEHVALTEAPDASPILVTATMTDPSGIFAPSVYFRRPGASTYESTPMATETEGNEFVARLNVKPPFEYWLEAYDNHGNGPTRSGTPETPYSVQVKAPELPRDVLELANLPPEQSLDEFDAPRESNAKWWIIGGSSVVGAAVIGGVIYALASGPDYAAWVAAQPPRHR